MFDNHNIPETLVLNTDKHEFEKPIPILYKTYNMFIHINFRYVRLGSSNKFNLLQMLPYNFLSESELFDPHLTENCKIQLRDWVDELILRYGL